MYPHCFGVTVDCDCGRAHTRIAMFVLNERKNLFQHDGNLNSDLYPKVPKMPIISNDVATNSYSYSYSVNSQMTHSALIQSQ